MYTLKLYEYGTLDSILYFRSRENAEAKAREIVQKVVDHDMKQWEKPQDYDCNTWEEYIEYVVTEDWSMDEVFSLETIEFED